MWNNISQRRALLRFRQAIANSDDTRVRIDDSAEDREPKFYTRQLLVDFEPKDVHHAWRIKTDSLPFGFEFIAHATFRDINFGELGKPGDKADWGPRIAQGNDTLYKHAIEGFTGSKGMMPPRGGGASLTDDEVKSAVDFMVAKSK